jgi:hypothetical protein
MEDEPNPAMSKAGYKSLLAKQYAMLSALTDDGDGDPEIQAYLARLARALESPDE